MLSAPLPAETSGHIGPPACFRSLLRFCLPYGSLPVRQEFCPHLPFLRPAPVSGCGFFLSGRFQGFHHRTRPAWAQPERRNKNVPLFFSYCLFSGTFLYLISAACPSRQSLFRSVRPVFSPLPVSLPGSRALYLQICTTSRAIHKFVSQLKSPEREIFQESHEFRRLTPVPALA